MDILDNIITQVSNTYTKRTDTVKLKRLGQFFTTDKGIRDKLFSHVESNQDKEISILEPSCGTGCIITECLKNDRLKNVIIDGVEIDKDICKEITPLFENYKNVSIYNGNFLERYFDKQYDIIVGNPPYFEIRLDENQKKQYRDITNGRMNIYSLFIYKSLGLLKQDGQLIFIIPNSILSSLYFEKLRRYIISKCNILDIIPFEKDDLFKKAKQPIIILKLIKSVVKDDKFVAYINGRLFFVKEPRWNALNSDNTSTIKSLGCSVSTGNIVWNQYKDYLRVDKEDNNEILIMSKNIIGGTLKLCQKIQYLNGKHQYLCVTDNTKNKLVSGPMIVVNRIIGNEPRLKTYFEKSEKKYFVENHVNVIKGPISSLDVIYTSLNKPETIEVIRILINNTQLSKSELENIIPIYT